MLSNCSPAPNCVSSEFPAERILLTNPDSRAPDTRDFRVESLEL